MAVAIVAECCLNHGGSLRTALTMADAAKECGADIAKFQTFDPGHIPITHPARDAIIAARLVPSETIAVAKHCERSGIEFLSTPGDIASLRFLVEECGVKRIKIGSDDMLNWPLLEAAARTGLPLIVSTGMASWDDVRSAWRPICTSDITWMQCTSIYPCPPHLVNLRAMDELRGVASPMCHVGYSDHTTGTTACVAAAALGASIIEKHFMLAETPDCLDAAVSVRPRAFKRMVEKIREVELMLGDGRKVHRPEENEARRTMRKVVERV
jgi:sialic acid synthase SpsE